MTPAFAGSALYVEAAYLAPALIDGDEGAASLHHEGRDLRILGGKLAHLPHSSAS